MYSAWKQDPKSVHPAWNEFFLSSPSSSLAPKEVEEHRLAVRTQQLVRAYRVFGHYHAKLDPLGLVQRPQRRELQLDTYGLTPEDLDRVIPTLDAKTSLTGYGSESESYTLKDLIKNLEASYCGSVGVEYMHIQDRDQCNWLRSRVELNVVGKETSSSLYTPSKEDRINCLDRLLWATRFEEFLQQKFSDKRFGCDGAETMIPGIKTLVDHAAALGVQGVGIGMAHRGRINILANVVRKPLENIFVEFQAGTQTMGSKASGDVKYHLGVSYLRPTRKGQEIYLSLLANPSHLEAVNPVVEGKVAAKQYYSGDAKKDKWLSLLIHGDGSFAGQGVVFESLMLSGLPKYTTGGTVHVIVNNQVSFTTDPADARPGEYCTDVALTNEAPIFHVNGDDPDAVCWVFQLAADWRQKFHKDVVIDLVCYRRYGHNEIDQPAFTQPLMYKKIAEHPKTIEIYAKNLISEGVLTAQEYQRMVERVDGHLEVAFEKSAEKASQRQKEANTEPSSWIPKTPELRHLKSTGIPRDLFSHVGKGLFTVPDGFTLHTTVAKPMKAKEASITSGKGIDWGTAEAIAFGSLLMEGFHVRISGQDVERGTFSHRHAVLHDQQTGEEYIPLAHLEGSKAMFSATNSFLSEYAALGYELGFSLESPNALVIWEAQFGDFSNGAQIIIDQFITSSEQKWMRETGLVMLLPHGMDGMGPEHSSARLERFLMMVDQDADTFVDDPTEALHNINMQVMNLTTPANYFHALRGQVYSTRKPLVVMSPKSLLRVVKSDFEEFSSSSTIQQVIPDTSNTLSAESTKTLIFCSGKVYFDLLEQRNKRNRDADTAIVRIEVLAPFPFHLVKEEIEKYPNATVIWAQEEHMNQGAWNYMYFRFATVFNHLKQEDREISYRGRLPAASPATGNKENHSRELAQFLDSVYA